jgi:hypothetical protein
MNQAFKLKIMDLFIAEYTPWINDAGKISLLSLAEGYSSGKKSGIP